MYLICLAVSALIGDAVLHLIPHVSLILMFAIKKYQHKFNICNSMNFFHNVLNKSYSKIAGCKATSVFESVSNRSNAHVVP